MPVYGKHISAWKTSGSKGAQVLQKVDNPNEIVIILKYETVEKARALAQSEDLRNAMQRADVNSVSDVIFVNEI